MRRRLIAAFLLLTLPGCRGAPDATQDMRPAASRPGLLERQVRTATAGAQDTWTALTARRCSPPALLDTTGWQRVPAEPGASLLLPADFVLDTGARGIDIYGRVWRRGAARIEWLRGATRIDWRHPSSWSGRSFATPRNRDGSVMSHCRWRFGGRPLMTYAPAGLEATYRGFGPYGPPTSFQAATIVSASPSAADTLLFWTVARTVRLESVTDEP